MKIENTDVYGLEASFRGLRNPMNSWDKSDSISGYNGIRRSNENVEEFIIGLGDIKLAQNLILAGNEHGKFLRMIQVWVDLTLPRYIWSEFDTYHYNTKNSCSTMHKLLDKNHVISTLDFEINTEYEQKVIENTINELNGLRNSYFKVTKQEDKDSILSTAKGILPESYLQKRTVNTNYAELRNMYFHRKYHRLKQWHTICDWIEQLPYANELITIEKGDVNAIKQP
jgi:hypothetical protein